MISGPLSYRDFRETGPRPETSAINIVFNLALSYFHLLNCLLCQLILLDYEYLHLLLVYLLYLIIHAMALF